MPGKPHPMSRGQTQRQLKRQPALRDLQASSVCTDSSSTSDDASTAFVRSITSERKQWSEVPAETFLGENSLISGPTAIASMADQGSSPPSPPPHRIKIPSSKNMVDCLSVFLQLLKSKPRSDLTIQNILDDPIQLHRLVIYCPIESSRSERSLKMGVRPSSTRVDIPLLRFSEDHIKPIRIKMNSSSQTEIPQIPLKVKDLLEDLLQPVDLAFGEFQVINLARYRDRADWKGLMNWDVSFYQHWDHIAFYKFNEGQVIVELEANSGSPV